MMAVPLMILYEISILGAKLFGRQKSRREEAEKTKESAA
jgi:Sec-independent protein secretion pathway component TatC